jgi:hypothetical protein
MVVVSYFYVAETISIRKFLCTLLTIFESV